MKILYKVLASAIAIPAHILCYAAAWEIVHRSQYAPDGYFTLSLLAPSMVAIWAKNATVAVRTLAWLIGLAAFLIFSMGATVAAVTSILGILSAKILPSLVGILTTLAVLAVGRSREGRPFVGSTE